jgi:hypothetical protein
MKIMKSLTLTAVAAIAVALLFQTSITQADEQGKRDEHGQAATVTFTKWVTAAVNQPGLIATMEGVGGGDAGDGLFIGEVILNNATSTGRHLVAFYHFTGTEHAFTALVNVTHTGAGPGATAVITGVVTDGWLTGHVIHGKYTVIPPCGYAGGAGIGNCIDVTLEIQRDAKH